jgi:cell division protein FtsW
MTPNASTTAVRFTRARSRTPSSPGRGATSSARSARSARSSSPSRSGLVDAVRQVPTASLLLITVSLLCLFGLVMVGSASSVISISLYGTPWAILVREAIWMVVGGGVLFIAMKFDYRKWRRLSPLLLLVTFGLLCVVLVPGLGLHVQGSSRWIGFGELRIQPSELMKLALTIFAADFIARRLDEGSPDRRIMGPLLLVTASAGVLILAQPDMGTAMVVGCIALTMLFVSGVSIGPVLKLMAVAAALVLVVAVASPYRRERLLSFLDPSAHGSGSGYQVVQSLIGLGSGHLLGSGLGGGQQKWGFLPNAHTDFIFSVIGEELGLIGAVAVLLLLGMFVWFGIRTATRSSDRFGGLLAVGLVAWVASETLINIGAVIGVLPVTGIPLPFISFGGSSLVITMAAAGILINIARHEKTTRAHGAISVPRRGTERASAAATSGRGRGR